MNRFTLPLLTLCLSLAPVLCWAAEPSAAQAPAAAASAEPQAKANGDDAAQLKAALDERVELLTKVVLILTSQYQLGTVDFVQVSSAENDLCNAQLDSTDEPAKRIALLTKQLARAKDMLKFTQARLEAGTVTEVDVCRAKALCVEIKIKLLRERSRQKSPAPKG